MQPADSLTTRQKERRARVVQAAVTLAAEGGYDAVQIREVAARSEVALGTVYRYFVSKDHLLAAAMLESTQALARDVERNPAQGASIADRIIDVLERALSGLVSVPNTGMAMVTGLNSPGPEVGQVQEGLNDVMSGILSTAFPPDFDPEVQGKIIRTTEHVWGSAMTGWMIGWLTFDQVKAEVSDGIRLLLAGVDPAAS